MNTKDKIKSIIVIGLFTILIIIVTALIIQYPFFKLLIPLFAGLISLPFIILLNMYLNRDKDRFSVFKPTFLGLSFKEFIFAWITFWGILGVGSSIIQVQRQISNQEEQTKIQKGQLDDTRFSSSVALLESPNESTRIGGIYKLYFLAKESNEYRESVCYILCSYIRAVTSNRWYQDKNKVKPSTEIQTILDLLFLKNRREDVLIFNDCRKNLNGAFLVGARFMYSTLTNVFFDNAILNYADFHNSALNNVYFSEVELSNVYFWKAKLDSIYFNEVVVDGYKYPPAKLDNISFYEAELSNVYFIGAELSKVYFCAQSDEEKYYYPAKLDNINFHGTTLNDVDFSGAELSNVYFWKAKLDSVYFCKEIVNDEYLPTKLNSVSFHAAELSKVYFSEAELSKVYFNEKTSYKDYYPPAKLNGVTFHSATLIDVDFCNAILEKEICFQKTVLFGLSHKDIIRPGYSLKKTKEENKH